MSLARCNITGLGLFFSLLNRRITGLGLFGTTGRGLSLLLFIINIIKYPTKVFFRVTIS